MSDWIKAELAQGQMHDARHTKRLARLLGRLSERPVSLDQLVPAVESLGRRHVRYGVKAPHYDTVGAALLWTLECGLGQAFTPAVQGAWAETYTLLATVMKRATGGTSDAPP